MARITGTFVDFGVNATATPSAYSEIMIRPGFWRRELADMLAAGITDVIIARMMELGRTHYHSALLQEWDATDHTRLIMDAAGDLGMKVWLGGHLNAAFWDRNWDFKRMMRRDRAANEFIFRELWNLYSTHPALAGWYVSNEPDRDNVDIPDRQSALQECLAGIYTMAHRGTGLPVLVSPFFSKSLPPAELAAWWTAFLDRPMFDILAMQDGVGCFPRRDLHPADIPPYYTALTPVFQARKITFWNNVETFGPWPEPGDLNRIDRQYEAGKPYVQRSITWEYGHFLGRQLVGEDRYREFCAWNLKA